jgi:hypothetical protein
VFFFRGQPRLGEVGRSGGGVLRGASTPRTGRLAADRLKLLNFDIEVRCVPGRLAVLTGWHPIRPGTPDRPDHRVGRADAGQLRLQGDQRQRQRAGEAGQRR